MDHYEHRSWDAWHQHMAFVFVAQLFLLRIRHRLKKSPALALPQAALLLKVVLPSRRFHKKYVLEMLRYYQRRNWVAKRSHAKSQRRRSKK